MSVPGTNTKGGDVTTGQRMQQIKQAGEYLVAAELCRRGFIATTFTGNVPHYDIIAADNQEHDVHIQVKAIGSGSCSSMLANSSTLGWKATVKCSASPRRVRPATWFMSS